MPQSRKPNVTDELITYLEQTYPSKLPSEFRGEFDMGKRFGAQQVVEHLTFLRDQQRENMLGTQLSLLEN